MNFNDIFKSSFLENLASVSLLDMAVALILAFGLGVFIFFVYKKTYAGVMYSAGFGTTLIALTMITTVVILAVTSNVVLSLGMVGALSIVRFRTAIKDPLDIGFLFWAIAAGLTAGAGLYFAAVFGTVLIAVIYIVFSLIKQQKRSYLLILRYGDAAEENVNAVLGGMKYRLKNKTKTEGANELTIEVKVKNNDASSVSRFQEIEGVTSVTLLEYSGEYMN